MPEQTLEEKEIERGFLLLILVSVYPREMSIPELLARAKIQRGGPVNEKHIDFHLEYLTETGVIRVRELRAGSKKIRVARALKKGIDMCDGRLDVEPGIVLPES